VVTKHGRSFLGVNAQFAENGKLTVRCLSTIELFDRHTGANLSETIIKVLQKYEISLDQIYSYVTDNGRDMVSCGKILQQLQDLATDKEMYDAEDEELFCKILRSKYTRRKNDPFKPGVILKS
jgi:hypothetical protein